MSDYKDAYSDVSKYFIEQKVPVDSLEKDRYDRSKVRESKYNEDWKKQSVNLNEIVDEFILDKGEVPKVDTAHEKKGVKYTFIGSQYDIICDKASGYLRIYDKNVKQYCQLDGTPSSDQKLTHFKIKKREEM